MSYRRWESIEAFNAWHEAACAALDLPLPGINQASGEYDLDAEWTIAYTTPVTVAPDDIRAVVEDDAAALVPDGLGIPCDPPPAQEEPPW